MNICRDLLFFCLCVEVFTFELKNHNDFRISEALIFEQCKKDHGTLIINDDSKQLSPTQLQQLHGQFYSVMLYDGKNRYQYEFSNKTKVDAILITTSSTRRLTRIIGILRGTMWWNVMIPVYILNVPNNNCEIAIKLLQRMWEYNILTSYFLCIKNNGVQIYTYNPFTSRAPSNWMKMHISTKEPQWTLYRRKYQTETICQDLDFDRTKYLDGYLITAVARIAQGEDRSFLGHYINYNHKHWNGSITERRNHLIIDALTTTLNISIRLYLVENDLVAKNITDTQLLRKDIFKNVSVNLVLFKYRLYSKTKIKNSLFRQAHPLAWFDNGIATYNRGYRTLGEKIWDFYGIWTILFTIFVLLVTFIVIWFSESGKTAFAVFEIIRLLTSHSLYTRMNTLPLRIFFITILIYFLIVQATFHGHLAKFLTKPELRSHPETRRDLKNFGYTVYDLKYLKENLEKINIEQKSRTQICLGHILYNDSSVACVLNYFSLLDYSRISKTENLYVSKKPIESVYSTFRIRSNWPLSNRVNMVLMLIEEMGFRQSTSGQLKHKLTHNSTVAEARLKKNFHSIKLENLMFSFWILAVGLISATFCFCVEMYIHYQWKLDVISSMKNIKKRTLNIMNRIKISCKFRK